MHPKSLFSKKARFFPSPFFINNPPSSPFIKGGITFPSLYEREEGRDY
jgi:hypothetical protein